VDEAARLPTLLDRFAPRAVLVVFVPNDATTLRDDDPAADLVRARARNDPPLRLVALAQAALGRAARDRAAEETTLAPYTGADRSRWEAARLALVAMRDAATARGARFGVAYFPYLYRVGDERLAPIRDAVAATCAEAGAPFLDITTAFRGERDRALWVHPTDQHPNPRAHELAARAMVPFVEGLLR
jgi:lysophospholipase L1-like esterase